MDQCRSQAIDRLFVTPELLGHASGYLSGLDGVMGDHHGLWIDLPEQWIFGGSMPGPTGSSPMTHALAIGQEHLKTFFEENLILQKAQQLETALLTQTLQIHHFEELEHLDDLHIKGMLKTECQ